MQWRDAAPCRPAPDSSSPARAPAARFSASAAAADAAAAACGGLPEPFQIPFTVRVLPSTCDSPLMYHVAGGDVVT